MNSRKQRGVAAVEFAIVAPLLFVLLFGIIEFSVVLFDQATITNASREGARAGIVYRFDVNTDQVKPLDNAGIETIVNNYAGGYLKSLGGASSLTTIIIREGMNAGDDLTVTVNYTYTFLVLRPLVGLLGGILPDAINLSATSVMRME